MTEPDITKLAYEKITDKYYKATYLGMECIMDITNGYINGTKFCSSCRDKTKILSNYIDRARYKILTAYYMSNITEYSSDLSIKVTDSIKEIRGTYIHPILFLDLAIWISPTAYIKATQIIANSLIKNVDSDIDINERLSSIEEKLEFALKKREDAEQRALSSHRSTEEVILKIFAQNQEINSKIDKADKKLDDSEYKIKLSLKRVEIRVEKIAELIHNPPLNPPQKKSWWNSCFPKQLELL
jgi:hypothetical protein